MAVNTYAVNHTAITIEEQLNLASGARIAAAGTEASAYTQTAYSTAVRTTTAPVTDSTGGAAQAAAAAGVGVSTLAFYIDAATIADGDLLTTYVPGYKFKILSFDARCAKAVTTGAKASTLNMEIGTTNLTGGAIALSGTYALGAAQAGSAVSGNNTGTSTDSFSIEASSTTTFVEGAFWLLVKIQNMDTADAFAGILANNITQAGLINSLIDDSQAVGISA